LLIAFAPAALTVARTFVFDFGRIIRTVPAAGVGCARCRSRRHPIVVGIVVRWVVGAVATAGTRSAACTAAIVGRVVVRRIVRASSLTDMTRRIVCAAPRERDIG
jgi:hypothetical protein